MLDFHMAALMFLTGHGVKARTHACAEIAHFPTRCIIRTWDAVVLWPHPSQALMMNLIGKCSVSTWAWVLPILLQHSGAVSVSNMKQFVMVWTDKLS